jgi:acyl carrier protein
MTKDEIRAAVVAELTNVAPEVEPADVPNDTDLREALDIDSMDFLNVIIALHQRLGVDIPEVDYGKLTTLNDAVAYLSGRIEG